MASGVLPTVFIYSYSVLTVYNIYTTCSYNNPHTDDLSMAFSTKDYTHSESHTCYITPLENDIVNHLQASNAYLWRDTDPETWCLASACLVRPERTAPRGRCYPNHCWPGRVACGPRSLARFLNHGGAKDSPAASLLLLLRHRLVPRWCLRQEQPYS